MKIHNYFSFNFISTLLSEIKLKNGKFSVKIKHVKLIQKCFIKMYVLKVREKQNLYEVFFFPFHFLF